MGFTWIFAFSAAFTGVAAIWYIYIIINSLQGLYIFFAFTLNARIARLWKDKITRTYSGYRTAESSTSKTNTIGNTNRSTDSLNGVGQHELTYQTGNTILTDDTDQRKQSTL